MPGCRFVIQREIHGDQHEIHGDTLSVSSVRARPAWRASRKRHAMPSRLTAGIDNRGPKARRLALLAGQYGVLGTSHGQQTQQGREPASRGFL